MRQRGRRFFCWVFCLQNKIYGLFFSVEKVVDRWQRLLSSMTSDMGGAINNPPTSCCELKGKTISVVMPSYGRAHLLKKTIPTYLQRGVVELILVDE